MTGAPVRIGPFTGGLNTLNEPSQIQDTECVELFNLEVDLDGSVVNRPALSSLAAPTTGGSVYLGTYISTTGITYFIYQIGITCRAYDVAANSWSTINSNIVVSNTVQYLNKLWLIAATSSATNGGSWDPSGGFSLVASMPRGIYGTVYKERLFIATGPSSTNPSRVNFSGAANFSTWSGTDFFDVANGDGQAILRIHSWNSQIVIFKQFSTYTFGYDSSPTRGVAAMQSSTIGIASPHSLSEYEGNLYIIWGNYLYSIVNWSWEQLNVKVPFTYYSYKTKVSSSDFTLSIIGNRLIARFYDNFYVYGLKSRAFSIWRYNVASYTPSNFVRYPNLDATTGQTFYLAPDYDLSSSTIYKLIDSPTNDASEQFVCSIITKTYSFDVPYTFKRLFHWGVDVLAETPVQFKVIPTAYNVPVTWGQLKDTYTWSQLKTWARPIDTSLDVTDSADSANPSNIRTYIKLLKSLRFRQISFKLSTTVDGTKIFRLFTIIAFTSNKEFVSRKIS